MSAGRGPLVAPWPDAVTRILPRLTLPQPGTSLDCAVSGGPDSTALMVLAAAHGCRVTAHHVDHGLRPGSEAEADMVAFTATLVGAGFRSHVVHVAGGPNLEARARAARRGVLPTGVATGHTMDDQAETVLLNALRGAGTDGLAAMAPGPAHPLLGIRRADTEALCAALGLAVVRDPTNADPVHVRNRVRAELLPLCCAIAGRDVVPVLARQAALRRQEAEVLDDAAAAAVPDPQDARALARAPLALARRAVRRWLRGTGPGDEEHPPTAAEVERVLAVASGEAVATELAGGRRVGRSRGRLSVTSGGPAAATSGDPPAAPGARVAEPDGFATDQSDERPDRTH